MQNENLTKTIKLLLGLTILFFASAWVYYHFFNHKNIGYELTFEERRLIEQFELQPNFSINLFASEQDFALGNVVSMTFDARGRLWALTMPTYPHYFPGEVPRDKLLILEDTDGDGKADKQTIFADSLYLPTGFELGNGGAYVAAQENLLFLKDTNGDNRADEKNIILHGFGSEDSHHSISSFEWGPDGCLYFHQGVFFHSQIETPYGPVRLENGGTFRYNPRTEKLEVYVSYNFANPWGMVFNEYGQNFIADASGGANYFANPFSGKVNFPRKHKSMKVFTSVVRPTCGAEFISSKHFPEAFQNYFLINNNIGFQGVKQHEIFQKNAGFESEDKGSFLKSNDEKFRPVDLQIGPDGALYVTDWHNPIIGHMQYSLRDSARDHSHGRIWRVTYNEKRLLKPINFAEASTSELFEYLDHSENRTKYRARIELWNRDKETVLEYLPKFISKNKKNERLLLEALWLHQSLDEPNLDLLEKLLDAKDYRVRGAAIRVMRYWVDYLPNSVELLDKMATDTAQFVRMETAVALSFLDSKEAVEIAVKISNQPQDYYIKYALSETMEHLKPIWKKALIEDPEFLSEELETKAFLYQNLSLEELEKMPKSSLVLSEILMRENLSDERQAVVLFELSKLSQTSEIQTLLAVISKLPPSKINSSHPLLSKLLESPTAVLVEGKDHLTDFITNEETEFLRQNVLAALVIAEGGIPKSEKSIYDLCKAIQFLPTLELRKSLHEIIEKGLNHSDEKTQNAAIEALAFLPDFDQEKLDWLMPKLGNSTFQANVAFALQSLNLDEIGEGEIQQLSEKLTQTILDIPIEKRDENSFAEMLWFLRGIIGLLPSAEAEKLEEELTYLELQTVNISTVISEMVYDKKYFKVQAGKPVKVVLSNPDVMPHNFVITEIGALEEVGKLGDAMASDENGQAKNFIPESNKILFAMPLVQPGKSRELFFKAPEKPGKYPFVCTYPNHWTLMNGVMEVVLSNDAENDVLMPKNVKHLGNNRRIRLLTNHTEKHPNSGAKTLNDGKKGSEKFNDGNWLGFEGEHLIADIDLGAPTDISKVIMGCYQDVGAWIWMPRELRFYASENSPNKFKPLGKMAVNIPDRETGVITKNFEYRFPETKARYIRVEARNRKTCPEWHDGAGGKSWIFVDEVVVQ